MLRRILALVLFTASAHSYLFAQQHEKLIYHDIKTDKNGYIVPWKIPHSVGVTA